MGVVSALFLCHAMDLLIHCSAYQLGVKRSVIKLPWEREPVNPVFAKRPKLIQPPVFVPVLMPADTQVSLPEQQVEGRIRWSRTTSLVPWPIAQDRALARTLEAWRIIIMDNLTGTMVGKQIEDAMRGVPHAGSVEQIISDALSGKSVSTLRSRSSSLLAFARWKKGLFERDNLFPMTELEAYSYVKELRELNAPRSKASRFLEAVAFAHHLLGAEVGNTLISSRVKGAITIPVVIPRKKLPLTVAQVRFLEQMAMDGQGQEAIFCGYVCMILHMRLRWSDGQYCQREPVVDLHNGKGFLECELYHHKNAGRQKHAKRLLPGACNIPGLSGEDWASPWLQGRLLQGLRAGPGIPTMPAPLSGGGWALLPLEPSQATTWLREIIRSFEPLPMPSDIGTHSLKATWLSMLAKAGCDGDLRRLAGYHTDPGAKMALEYSRDAQAPVLLAMEAVGAAITHGLFDPDTSRARRWPRKGCNSLQSVMLWLSRVNAEELWYQNQNRLPESHVEPEEDLEGCEVAVPPSEPYSPSAADEDDAESISSLSAASARPELGRVYNSSDEDRDAEVAAPIVGEDMALNLEQQIVSVVFRHVHSECCHVARDSGVDPLDGEAVILKCGKIATKNFEQVRLAGNFLPYKCSRCFAGT